MSYLFPRWSSRKAKRKVWRSDVLESLARAQRWDLVIVDEAHKMAAYRRCKKLERTCRYRLGEFLTDHTEHLLLLTATPHKGDPENFLPAAATARSRPLCQH